MMWHYLIIGLVLTESIECFGWAAWSQWSECSKTCGGGISRQLRRCLVAKCSGESARYRVCAQKDCATRSRSPRDTVCGGEEIVSRQQCEVVCRSRTTRANFLWRVDDGSPCQAATSRAVCSKGSCQIVGCDGLVGSNFRFDACGVCGGRGDTCENGKFKWRVSEEYTACATSCDDLIEWRNGNELTTSSSHSQPIVVCVNADTGRVVPERLCADKQRPKVDTRPCPLIVCPSRWMASDWSECIPYCGPGTRQRQVFCVQSANNSTVQVTDEFCANYTRPTTHQDCESPSCGKWIASGWSTCSSTCGQGVRKRRVVCTGGQDCDETTRPREVTTCYAGIPCAGNSLNWNENQAFLDDNQQQHEDDELTNDWQSPRLVAGEWSSCSATCGSGVMSRSVECVATNPLTATPVKLPMSECQGQSHPKLFEACETRSCPLKEDDKSFDTEEATPFQWRYGDWTQCSASCLGGKQKAALKCVQVATNTSVQWSQCDARRRPPEKSRACNQHPCPPFWMLSKFSSCSSSCGGGTADRSVKCAQTVSKTDGADAHIILRDEKCHQPRPVDRQKCNLIDCPPTWVTSQWTECSRSCGSGERRRRVWCEMQDASGSKRTRDALACATMIRPADAELCNLGACELMQHRASNRVYEQMDAQKKLTLSIGGVATVYQGTSIKIKCPAKKFDKKKVFWTKNGKRIKNDAHVKVSSNGNLRLFHARMEDAGVYECFTDRRQGNVTLNFKYREVDALPPRLVSNRIVSGDRNATNAVEAMDVQEMRALVAANRLAAQWHIGKWSSTCRQKTCHISGYQARKISCRVTADGRVRDVDTAVCDAISSAVRPPETRPCHRADCPRWEASAWSECSSTRCVASRMAMKWRNVTCRYTNGTEAADEQFCDVTNRPKPQAECANLNCKAEWRTSAWGSCSSECGTGGVQLRLLSCVWVATGRAAGRNCEQMRRPHSARACVADEPLPPCGEKPLASALRQQADASCQDQSRFCDIIKLFHSCDSVEVRQKCCSTCTFVEKRRRRRL